VLRRLKADKNTRDIPVVVLAKSERQPDLTESLRLGAETFLLKPVDFQRLADVVPRLNLSWNLVQAASPSPG
jgi:CheY-like chemotaxis protein